MTGMLKDLAGKRAIVTGGATGIGFSIARHFADAGMRVANNVTVIGSRWNISNNVNKGSPGNGGGRVPIPEPVQRAALAELREMAADVAMSNDDVRALQSIARQIPEAPSDADRIAWREQAVTRLNETYGNGAAQAFRDARAFIAQDPRRAKILDNKGLGDHPDTVLMVARLARQARMQGKLK